MNALELKKKINTDSIQINPKLETSSNLSLSDNTSKVLEKILEKRPKIKKSAGFVSSYNPVTLQFDSIADQVNTHENPVYDVFQKILTSIQESSLYDPQYFNKHQFRKKSRIIHLRLMFILGWLLQFLVFWLWFLKEMKYEGIFQDKRFVSGKLSFIGSNRFLVGYWLQVVVTVLFFQVYAVLTKEVINFYLKKRQNAFYLIIKETVGDYVGPRVAFNVGDGGAWITCRYLDSKRSIS